MSGGAAVSLLLIALVGFGSLLLFILHQCCSVLPEVVRVNNLELTVYIWLCPWSVAATETSPLCLVGVCGCVQIQREEKVWWL